MYLLKMFAKLNMHLILKYSKKNKHCRYVSKIRKGKSFVEFHFLVLFVSVHTSFKPFCKYCFLFCLSKPRNIVCGQYRSEFGVSFKKKERKKENIYIFLSVIPKA